MVSGVHPHVHRTCTGRHSYKDRQKRHVPPIDVSLVFLPFSSLDSLHVFLDSGLSLLDPVCGMELG